MTNDKPEFELLLWVCNPRKDLNNKDKINSLLTKNIDWEAVLKLTQNHGITSLFYQNVKELDCQNIPQNALDCLKETSLSNSFRNVKFAGELLRLTKIFEQEKVPVISFKGPVLAQLIYQNLGAREFEDLDILIKEEQLIFCDNLLKKEGYTPQFELNNEQLGVYRKLRSEFIYWHPQKDITIDLHWRLLPKYFSFSDSAEFPWQNQQKVLLNKNTITTLSNELNLLFLCSHGSKHDWLYLCWIIDLAKFIQENRDLDWSFIVNQTGNIATQKMLLLGLDLVNTLFNIPLPKIVINLIKKEPKLRDLSNNIKYQLFQEKEVKEGYIIPRIYLQTMTSLRDKIWFWIDTIMTPTALELKLILLPKFLFPLYYIIRLFRLSFKYLSWKS